MPTRRILNPLRVELLNIRVSTEQRIILCSVEMNKESFFVQLHDVSHAESRVGEVAGRNAYLQSQRVAMTRNKRNKGLAGTVWSGSDTMDMDTSKHTSENDMVTWD